jgi:regulatory protein
LALALLARREHSRQELTRKLRRRGFEADKVATLLDRLAEQGCLSDRRFAEQYVRERIARGFGPLRIRSELKDRGVSGEAAAIALQQQADDWRVRADRARRKRFGDEIPQDLRERARQVRFLQYRGFSADHIKAVLADSTEPYDV